MQQITAMGLGEKSLHKINSCDSERFSSLRSLTNSTRLEFVSQGGAGNCFGSSMRLVTMTCHSDLSHLERKA